MRLNISEGARLSHGLIAHEQTTLLKGGYDCNKKRSLFLDFFPEENTESIMRSIFSKNKKIRIYIVKWS